MQIYCSLCTVALTAHLQNVIGGTGLDMLTSTPPGVSGPLSRDIGYVFEAAFVHRKDVGAEIAAFIRTFAKREPKFKSQITAATQNLKQATTVFETCKARSENFEKVCCLQPARLHSRFDKHVSLLKFAVCTPEKSYFCLEGPRGHQKVEQERADPARVRAAMRDSTGEVSTGARAGCRRRAAGICDRDQSQARGGALYRTSLLNSTPLRISNVQTTAYAHCAEPQIEQQFKDKEAELIERSSLDRPDHAAPPFPGCPDPPPSCSASSHTALSLKPILSQPRSHRSHPSTHPPTSIRLRADSFRIPSRTVTHPATH
jgi:hypothetical protein